MAAVTAVDGINALLKFGKGKTDKESHLFVKQIIKAIEDPTAYWPKSLLHRIYLNMGPKSRRYFCETVYELDKGLEEALNKDE